jgi:trimeric autotransporter adhesin
MKMFVICIALVLAINAATYAQDIESKLSGNTATQGFTVKDNSATSLFTVRGSGSVGIGTTAPTADLHVSGLNGFLVTGTYGSGTIPATGTGTRMMFYPKKEAFRVGWAVGTQWDDVNIGNCSIAMGFQVVASGASSVAMGMGTNASGAYSTAMGSQTVASGERSTAMGENTTSSGDFSTAMGFGTNANAWASTAIGQCNVGGGTTGSWVATDPLFEIGNGIPSAKANAMTVLKNGNVGIGTATPDALLHVIGQVKITGGSPGAGKVLTSDAAGLASWAVGTGAWTTSGSNIYYSGGNVGIGTATPMRTLHMSSPSVSNELIMEVQDGQSDWKKWNLFVNGGTGNAQNLTLRILNDAGTAAMLTSMTWLANGNVGISTSAPGYKLEVNGTAGKPGGGSWSTSSDSRLKNIEGDYARGLNDILRLRSIRFHYKPGNPRRLPSEPQEIGFVAQEVAEVFPECVTEGKDGYLDFNMHAVNVAMVNAIKELKTQKDAEIGALREEVRQERQKTAVLEESMTVLREELKAIKAELADRNAPDGVTHADLRSR